MLALKRNDGETIRIGDNIVVTLVRSNIGNALIGIEAPRHIPIVRDDAVKQSPKDRKETDQ